MPQLLPQLWGCFTKFDKNSALLSQTVPNSQQQQCWISVSQMTDKKARLVYDLWWQTLVFMLQP